MPPPLAAACLFGQFRGFAEDNRIGAGLRGSILDNVLHDFEEVAHLQEPHTFFVVSLQNSIAQEFDRDSTLEKHHLPPAVEAEIAEKWNVKSLVLYDAEDRFVEWRQAGGRGAERGSRDTTAGGGSASTTSCRSRSRTALEQSTGRGENPARAGSTGTSAWDLQQEEEAFFGRQEHAAYLPPCAIPCRRVADEEEEARATDAGETNCVAEARSQWASARRMCAWQGQWEKTEICFRTVQEYERQNQVRYRWLLRVRVDLAWLLPFSGSWHAREFVRRSAGADERASGQNSTDNSLLTSVSVVARSNAGLPDAFFVVPGPAVSSTAAAALFHNYREFAGLCLPEDGSEEEDNDDGQARLQLADRLCHVCRRRRSGAGHYTTLLGHAEFGVDDGNTLLAQRLSSDLFATTAHTAHLYFVKTDRLSADPAQLCSTEEPFALASKCHRVVAIGMARELCLELLRALFCGGGGGQATRRAGDFDSARTVRADADGAPGKHGAGLGTADGGSPGPRRTDAAKPRAVSTFELIETGDAVDGSREKSRYRMRIPGVVEVTLRRLRGHLTSRLPQYQDSLFSPVAQHLPAPNQVQGQGSFYAAFLPAQGAQHWALLGLGLQDFAWEAGKTLLPDNSEVFYYAFVQLVGAVLEHMWYFPARPFCMVHLRYADRGEQDVEEAINRPSPAEHLVRLAKRLLARFFPEQAARAEFAEVEVVSEELVGAAGGAEGATGAAGIRVGCGLIDLLVLDLRAQAVRTEKPEDEPGRHLGEEKRARPAVAELQAFLLQALPTERFFMSPPSPAAGSSQSAAPNSVERVQWNVRRALVFGGTGPAENGLDPPAVKQMLTRDIVDATAQEETWDFGEEGVGLVSRRWPFLDLARGAHLPFKTREDCAIEKDRSPA